MKAKVVKDRKGNTYLLLPSEIDLEGEVEIFPLKDGYYLITPPLPPRGEGRKLTKEQVALLQKVSLIPYSRRELNQVLSQLSEREQALLHGLINQGVIFLRKKQGKSYIAFEEGLYDKLKALSRQEREREGKEEKEGNVEVLDLSQGFLIIKSPKTFYKLRSYLEENRRKLRYLIDPTNGYLYIATRSFLERGAKALLKELSKGEKSAYHLSKVLHMPLEGVETIAKFLNEEGLLYEKDPKKKIYGVVE